MPTIQVCLSPALFPFQIDKSANVVVVDILRATSSICEAFKNGVERIIPVSSIEEAMEYKQKGFVVAAERDGIVLDFADFGNSPDNFSSDMVAGKSIAYSTTNGTKTIHIAAACKSVMIGSFLNFTAVCESLLSKSDDVIVLCAGWKDRVNIEDSLFAGAVVDRLLCSGRFTTDCDSAKIARSIWKANEFSSLDYVNTSAQKKRLNKNGLDGCIDYCMSHDVTAIVPVFFENFLVSDKKA